MSRRVDVGPVSAPTWVFMATGAAVLLTVSGTIGTYQSLHAGNTHGKDVYRVAAVAARLREPARLLPTNAITGYVSDVPASDPRGGAAFFAVQYAVAPRLLVEAESRSAPDWIVGYFAGFPDYEALAKSRGWVLVRDFGGGVTLFRRKPR